MTSPQEILMGILVATIVSAVNQLIQIFMKNRLVLLLTCFFIVSGIKISLYNLNIDIKIFIPIL